MAKFAKELKDILNLQRAPVGVKFLKAEEEVDFTGYDGATKSRYCWPL
ncbi:hypothetical protein [Methanohalophilus sp.]|nr:hypothetical protein [Methanohalophilus sp.]MDK2892289.1 hypothetical protein [Methanohalophilus sp.]